MDRRTLSARLLPLTRPAAIHHAAAMLGDWPDPEALLCEAWERDEEAALDLAEDLDIPAAEVERVYRSEVDRLDTIIRSAR